MKSEIKFFRHAALHAIIMFGYTYFSVAIALQAWVYVTPSILAASLYFFTELMRYYKIPINDKKGFTFLI